MLALFSTFFNVSIDHCSRDFEPYSLALLGKTEPEKAIRPPTKKVMPVSRNKILEKYAVKKVPLGTPKVNITNIKKLAAQMIKSSFITHIRRDFLGNAVMIFLDNIKVGFMLCQINVYLYFKMNREKKQYTPKNMPVTRNSGA